MEAKSGVLEEDSGPSWTFREHTATLLICTAIAIIFTFWYLFWTSRKRGRGIVFVGPSEAGKTSLFVHLLNKAGLGTVTSTVANVGEYNIGNGKPELVLKDLPGHDRVRNKWWDEHKRGLRGVVCVVDAAGGSKSIRDAAEVLYWILTDSVVNSVKPNILVLANKQDLLMSKGERVIRTQLEREISTLRLTKSASLQTTGGSNTLSNKILGNPNRDFEFDHVAPIKVEFGKSCGKEDSPDLNDLLLWLGNVS